MQFRFLKWPITISCQAPLKLLLCPLLCFTSLTAEQKLPAYYPQEDHVASYLSNMPWGYYKLYNVTGLGSFWVDDAYDVVKDTIKKGKIWEPHILKLLITYIKPGDHVVDIGAHMGTISLTMSNLVGEAGMVYSFEGERQFFRELCYNVSASNRKNVMPHLCWVTDTNMELEMTQYYGDNYSPVHQSNDGPWNLHKHTLDSFNLDNIALMKIDVECTEDEVLRGAQETISRSRPILIIEIMGGFSRKDSRIRERIKNTRRTLQSMNYKVKKIKDDDYLAIPNERIPANA